MVAGRDDTAGGTPSDLRGRAARQWSRLEGRARREVTHLAGLSFDELAPSDAVRMAYQVLLRREPDPAAWAQYTGALAAGELSCDELVDRIRGSNEFRTNVRLHESALHTSLHASRCEFIIGLPRARRIVDLGGGHTTDGRGALVALGYPYDFEELVIVDLPPDDRHPLYHSERFLVSDTERGRVNYEYRSMVDLSFLEDGSVDLVYSGQSIEHVSEADGDTVLRHVRRILRPGGYLALDTPNGRLTRMQQDAFIDPDHEVEYTWPQLRDLIVSTGFEVFSAAGLNYGGEAARQGRFDLAELARHPGLHHAIEDCYILAVVAHKPV